jgi:murein DD-endopeptidase MepM/ murein hydrolase activator NlpD
MINMIRYLVVYGLLLAGCSPMTGVLIPDPTVSLEYFQTQTITPYFPYNTFTSLASPSKTNLPTLTPSETASSTPTTFPSETPISWSYVFPVEPSDLVDFSEGTASHGYPATDIFALEGSRFVAVTDGVVDYVSLEDIWTPEGDDPGTRGGLSVAIIGKDGVRYYGSHLSAIQPGILAGIQVSAGELLGYVGHTGDARNTPSHLHFGISRPSYPTDWHARRGEVDPFPFLVAWRDGHNVTPPLPTP